MRFLTTNLCTETATVVSASNIDASFPVSNIKNIHRSKRVRTEVGESELAIVFDMQTTEEINSVVLLWPKEDGIRLSETATVKIQANATNVWSGPAVDQALTIDNTYSVASHFFSSDQSYRYWRVVIEDLSNPWDYIELGTVWLGKGLDVDNAQNGFKYALNDNTQVSSTPFGHKYFDEYPQVATVEFSYVNMTYDQTQLLENAFRTNGARKPVLVVFDEAGTVMDKDHVLVYGTMGLTHGSQHVNYNIMNVDSIIVQELS